MSPQQTIAHYRITSKLGEGGMPLLAVTHPLRPGQQILPEHHDRLVVPRHIYELGASEGLAINRDEGSRRNRTGDVASIFLE